MIQPRFKWSPVYSWSGKVKSPIQSVVYSARVNNDFHNFHFIWSLYSLIATVIIKTIDKFINTLENIPCWSVNATRELKSSICVRVNKRSPKKISQNYKCQLHFSYKTALKQCCFFLRGHQHQIFKDRFLEICVPLSVLNKRQRVVPRKTFSIIQLWYTYTYVRSLLLLRR